MGTGELWAGLERAGWSLQNRSHCSRAHVERWLGPAGALVMSSIYPLRPNSRTVKDLEFLLMLFQNQTEIGPCSWRFARISAWAQGLPGYSQGVCRPFSHLPHHSCWCVCFENGGKISMCFPRISCSFLEALVPSPPYAVTSGLFQLRSLLVVY